MKDFYYKGNIVGCRNHVRRFSHLNRKNCFCCGNECKDGENVVLLINNYKSFANVLIHKDCFEQWEHNTDELCKDLESAYEDYKKLNMIFGSYSN